MIPIQIIIVIIKKSDYRKEKLTLILIVLRIISMSFWLIPLNSIDGRFQGVFELIIIIVNLMGDTQFVCWSSITIQDRGDPPLSLGNFLGLWVLAWLAIGKAVALANLWNDVWSNQSPTWNDYFFYEYKDGDFQPVLKVIVII